MTKDATTGLPFLGFGLGLRVPHYAHILEHKPAVDWFEIISENFMDTDGRPTRKLAQFREHYPIVMHGVSLSIGTVDPLNSDYLKKLKALKDWLNPAWISDHVCWTGIAHKNTHDLLPVPYTEEALKHIVSRIRMVQDALQCPIALENPSTYLEFKTSHMPEAEFIARMAEDADCRLLLDVNNVYVTCYNHRLDAKKYLDALPLHRVVQVHLSGHSNMGTHIIDTHDDHVVDDVWALYKYATHKAGRTFNTMIEWDDHIPDFATLMAELDKAKAAARDATNYAPLPDLAVEHPPYRANIVTPLAHAQQQMQDAILQGEDSEPASWIKEKENFTAEDQLGVYIDGYRARLYNVVAEDYPVLKTALNTALGDDAFPEMLSAFIEHTSSDHFNIARYSAHLPAFLAQYEQASPFTHGIARLESAIAQVQDAPETTPLTAQHLAAMTPDALMESRLPLRAALQLFAFDHPVNDYYNAVRAENLTPPHPTPQASYLVVYRHEDTVWRMALEEPEYHLLTALQSGKNVGDALAAMQEQLSLSDEQVAGEVFAWFSRWIRNGLLATSEEPGTTPIRSAA